MGKCERLWKTVKQELWERVRPRDLEEARERLAHYFGHYNHHRPHESLGGLVPADRFFDVAEDVRGAIERTVAKNALRLALGEAPRRPVFLVGQIDGQAVSVHGEAGKIVVQTPDGAVKEIASEDLGMGLGVKAKEVEHDEQDDEAGGPRGADGEDGGEAGGEAAAPGLEAHDVPGAGEGAGAGAGAVEEREPGGAGAGAPDGDDGAQGVAGEGEPGGGGEGAGPDAASVLADLAAGPGGAGGGVPEAAAVPGDGGSGGDGGAGGGAQASDPRAGTGGGGGPTADRAASGAAGTPGGRGAHAEDAASCPEAEEGR